MPLTAQESRLTTRRVRHIWDFRDQDIFPEVLTRTGAAVFQRDKANTFPIDYKILDRQTWTTSFAAPIGEATAPLSIFSNATELDQIKAAAPITVRSDQKPRQGANTCGANHVFIFDEYPADLPAEFIFPLLTKECFRKTHSPPLKFILLPYHQTTGKPLTEAELGRHHALRAYLNRHRDALANRKGTMLGAWMKRGAWWACLGVGKYSFAPYKVVWEAYGKSTFTPQVFSAFQGRPWPRTPSARVHGNQLPHGLPRVRHPRPQANQTRGSIGIGSLPPSSQIAGGGVREA